MTADLSGLDIGGFRLLALIGRGGMGEVYRAHDSRLGRDVAIKILPHSFGLDPDRLARFERESRFLASLNHPHIGAIYGLVEADGLRGLVLEFVEGASLQDRIATGLKPREALEIASHVADALDLAHEKGIIHRDLKPDNIRISPDGNAKVLDFGIARVSMSDTDAGDAPTAGVELATASGAVIGTAAFMSPEQARGLPVDKRTDIWSFGCVLYEMLTGRRAFGGPTASDTIAAVLEHEPDWSILPPATPPNIRRLLTRCLHKDPRRRLRDIGDARAELEAALSGDVEPPASAPSRRSALLPWALVAACVAIVAVLSWPGAGPVEPTALAPPRLLSTVRLTNTPEREFGPVIAPDGSWVAYYSDARGETDLWVKYLDNGATLNLTSALDLRLPVRANIDGLSVSPDGRTLAFFARTEEAQSTYDTWVIPAPLGGPPRRLLSGAQGVQWSPDGTRLAYIEPGSSLGDALIVADADGGNQRPLIPPEGGHHVHWPAWSHDSRSLYFTYTFQPWNTEQSEIYRVSASGGAVEPVVRTTRRAVYPVPMPDGSLLFSANPDSVDLGLWWRSPRGGEPQRLTTGIGEYAEARVSSDGRRLVAMVIEHRQSLVEVPVSVATPVARPLTDGYGGDLEPSHDPRSDRVVFSSTRSGHRNLWMMRQDGDAPRPLTSGTSSDHHPAFSPDGRTVAFVSDRGGASGIWLVSADGGTPRLLAPATVLDSLTWSSDGVRIVFATPGREHPTSLASVAIADGAIQPVQTPAAAVAPSASPIADVLAYLEPGMVQGPNSQIPPEVTFSLRFVNGQGQTLRTLTNQPRLTNGLVAWAPDGRRVAVVTVPANAPAVIWIVDPESPTPFRRLMELEPTARPRGLTWTNDGSRLIIASQRSLSDLVLHEIGR
jgi:serine/threonine protein kinase/Tol biopolymer transport system component